jgi:cyclic beta-1,2-glucan synthetase
MIDTAAIPQNQQPFHGDVLEYLHVATSWDVVHRPKTAGALPARILAAGRSLKRLERDLTLQPAATGSDLSGNSAALELRANLRLLRSAVRAVSDNPRVVAHLPRVVLPEQCDEPRVAAIAITYLRGVHWDFSAEDLRTFIDALQSYEPLTVDELWNLASFLKFVLLESILEQAHDLPSRPQPDTASAISVRLKSLRSIGHTDWQHLIEPLIVFDATLLQDPAQAYGAMDFDSRELYRARVAFIARHSDFTESQVAQAAIDLAREASQITSAENGSIDPRLQRRRIHAGYYLLDKGFPPLAARTGFHAPLVDRARTFIRAHADDFYITGIQLITIFLVAALMLMPFVHAALTACLIGAILLALPAMQCAVDLVNNSVIAILDPEPLPKLDFSNGVPLEFTTLVAVPSLLLNEEQIRALVNDLEVRFLASRDPHLHFALLTDLPDSVTKPRTRDSHPLVDLAIQLIGELNVKYSSQKGGGFILLHRHRIFNVRQGVWMGWERKRGKLLDLNKLLAGDFDAFPIKAGRLEALKDIRYVLTLDSDTQLPRGAAAKLVGAIAHPLNQAIIHPRLRIVTEGYGILQPRIGVSVRSASRSRLAALFSEQTGFDIYTRAISDSYQDLYGEGIFTGKGIYEVATLHAVLDRRFPRDSLLSHDLIEGAYARAGLTTDIELIDDFPSHLSAYNRRKHRWVRGDWQIAQWMFSRVPDESGRSGPSPISSVARWKIFDNLRRSLVEPFTFMLFVAGWIGLPGGPVYWTAVTLGLLFFPTFVQSGFALGRALGSGHNGSASDAISGFWRAMLVALLNLVFLPLQTLLCLDAIVRVFVRRFITGQRLLEWETAAQAEFRSASRTSLDRYLALTPLVALAVLVLICAVNPHSHPLYVAAPILLLWGLADAVTSWLNAPPPEQQARLGSADKSFLTHHALRIWRYFNEFGGPRHNYLIPDNVEEEGLYEAARVSPTNIGFLLNSRQAACEFGFLTVPEFVDLTERSLSTIARMEKHRGHLYNWYDTQTLEPLGDERFVSSVDSGNFLASLYTLRSGVLALAQNSLLPKQLFTGLRTHWELMQLGKARHSQLAHHPLPGPSATVVEWIGWLPAASAALSAGGRSGADARIDPWWLSETRRRIEAILALLRDYMPWLLPEFAPLLALRELAIDRESFPPVDDAAIFADTLNTRLARASAGMDDDSPMRTLAAQFQASVLAATKNLHTLTDALHRIVRNVERLAQEIDFTFLVDPGRRILSIGYDVRAKKLHESCYDLIASEARVATFLAIARDEIPQQSWFKLGRDHARAFEQFVLLSWTGTMFEYLMPVLWMRTYPNTLISRTIASCVQVQRAFARQFRIPWGISESGASGRDHAGHYHYHAYGVPQIALWIEATAGPIISSYSTFLALGVDSVAAVRNLRRMDSDGWVGPFGFYEAADFTANEGTPALVREWMAHHQGMSLLAILNLLHDNVVQRWFHSNPQVQSAELLLHELPVSNAMLKARLQE